MGRLLMKLLSRSSQAQCIQPGHAQGRGGCVGTVVFNRWAQTPQSSRSVVLMLLLNRQQQAALLKGRAGAGEEVPGGGGVERTGIVGLCGGWRQAAG